jgi:ubiquitin carboxyl-terminal hydrolase 7
MNSIIQTYNIFGAFKKAIFDIPTEDEDYNSVTLSLQRLFFDLLVKDKPVSTNKLIKSFGWGKEQIYMQHDVQEFNLLLSELMEKKMKGTTSEGIFNNLFKGNLTNYIECIDVNYKSEKDENFSDIQLTVKVRNK